jgi:splicing suppressor protein 51
LEEHKSYCNVIIDHTRLLESISNLNLIPVPDGLSLVELNNRLAKWVKYHTATLMDATIHALNAPKDFTRIRSHLLRVHVSPRSDHGGSPGKYFRIVDATVVSFADAWNFMPPWPDGLMHFSKLREESDRLKRGGVAMIGLECPPLGMQVVPFGSITKDIKQARVLHNWKDILTRDIENGRRMTWFGDNK